MTRISFYILAAQHPAGICGYACHLAEKAYLAGESIFMQVSNNALQAELETALWASTWGRDEAHFIPHECWTAGAQQPDNKAALLLGAAEPPASHYDLLINLSDDVPLHFSRFERVLEIIDANQPEAGRQRYQFYQQRGYPLQTYKIPAN